MQGRSRFLGQELHERHVDQTRACAAIPDDGHVVRAVRVQLADILALRGHERPHCLYEVWPRLSKTPTGYSLPLYHLLGLFFLQQKGPGRGGHAAGPKGARSLGAKSADPRPNYFKLCQTMPNDFELFQTISNYFKLFQTISN